MHLHEGLNVNIQRTQFCMNDNDNQCSDSQDSKSFPVPVIRNSRSLAAGYHSDSSSSSNSMGALHIDLNENIGQPLTMITSEDSVQGGNWTSPSSSRRENGKKKRKMYELAQLDPYDFKAKRALKQKQIRDRHKNELTQLKQLEVQFPQLQKDFNKLQQVCAEKEEEVKRLQLKLAEVSKAEASLRQQVNTLRRPQASLSQQKKDCILNKIKAMVGADPTATFKLTYDLADQLTKVKQEEPMICESDELRTEVSFGF